MSARQLSETTHKLRAEEEHEKLLTQDVQLFLLDGKIEAKSTKLTTDYRSTGSLITPSRRDETHKSRREP